jgi:luciferase family oxidoreductase group 1
MLAELVAFEQRRFPASHPFAAIEPMPADAPLQSIWMLGSTLAGASIAAQLGLPYAFAGHFAMRHAVDAIAHYRAGFTPTGAAAAPYAMLAVTCVCADTDEEAHRLAAPLRVAIVKNRTGRRAPILSVEDALAYEMSPAEQAIADEFFTGAIIGAPEHVAARLRALAADAHADELMLSSLVPDLARREHSLELIAGALA